MKNILVATAFLCAAMSTPALARDFTGPGWSIVYLKADGQPDKMSGQLGPYETEAACQKVFDGAPEGVPETNQQMALRMAQVFNRMGCASLKAPLPTDR